MFSFSSAKYFLLLAITCAGANAQVTLSSITELNTAACPASGKMPPHCKQPFTGQQDDRPHVATPLFDAPTGNVSDEDLHAYLNNGEKTIIVANFMMGFCTSGDEEPCHNNVRTGYNSEDKRTVIAQVQDLRRRNIDGAVVSWQGFGTREDLATLNFQRTLNANFCGGPQACDPLYVVMYDGASIDYSLKPTGIEGTSGEGCSHRSGKDYEDCAVAHIRNDMCALNAEHWGNDAYLKMGGRPVLMVFPKEEVIHANGPAPSWADVWVQIGNWVQNLSQNCGRPPYNRNNGVPLIVFEDAGGFNHAASSGAYKWVKVSGTDPDESQFRYGISPASDPVSLDHFFEVAQQHPNMLAWGAAFKGFNSSKSAWGANRILDQQCGQTWMKSLTASNRYYTGSALQFLQIATWNDYNEGTEIESGIDNCFTVSASVNGSSLAWSLDATNSAASLDTISHIEIYDSTDGQHLTLVSNQPPALNGSFDLTRLRHGKHQLYVRMVGRNSILNRISRAAAYTAR